MITIKVGETLRTVEADTSKFATQCIHEVPLSTDCNDCPITEGA